VGVGKLEAYPTWRKLPTCDDPRVRNSLAPAGRRATKLIATYPSGRNEIAGKPLFCREIATAKDLLLNRCTKQPLARCMLVWLVINKRTLVNSPVGLNDIEPSPALRKT